MEALVPLPGSPGFMYLSYLLGTQHHKLAFDLGYSLQPWWCVISTVLEYDMLAGTSAAPSKGLFIILSDWQLLLITALELVLRISFRTGRFYDHKCPLLHFICYKVGPLIGAILCRNHRLVRVHSPWDSVLFQALWIGNICKLNQENLFTPV